MTFPARIATVRWYLRIVGLNCGAVAEVKNAALDRLVGRRSDARHPRFQIRADKPLTFRSVTR